ncbi:MAG: glucosamine-6-phosphate deaminase [Myxococcota bacterium]|nr:glucosamine-6-phosphate deaminase [Myxococcota bacterium]
MQVVIASASEVVARAARAVAEVLGARPGAVLGLAAGRTMEPVYAALARLHRENGLSLATARAFLLDEYLELDRDDPRRLRAEVERALVGPTDLPGDALEAPDPRAADPAAEAARYEAAVREAGGVDLQLLGIGANGHLGFNEPGAALLGRTRVQVLAEATLAANRTALEAGGGRPPRAAITQGLGTLLAARRLVLVATGSAKAQAVAEAVEGPLAARVPASVLQLHPDALLLVDEAAAAGLRDPGSWRHAERVARDLDAAGAAGR